MTNEERQAQLLDDYLTALQKNADAPIPPELDPEMAQFAQMMVTPNLELSSQTAQSTVWQQITDKSVLDSSAMYHDNIQKERIMTLKEKKKNESKNRAGLLPLVASVVVSVGLSLVLAFVLFTSNEEQRYADTAEIEALAQIVTATPIPQIINATITPPPSPTFLPTAMPPSANTLSDPSSPAPEAIDPRLECNFEDEFNYRIQSNGVIQGETLSVTFTAFNPETDAVRFEVFGGFATNDQSVTMGLYGTPQSGTTIRVGIPQTIDISFETFPVGNYLVSIRLEDDNGETLSSCGLPVVVVNE